MVCDTIDFFVSTVILFVNTLFFGLYRRIFVVEKTMLGFCSQFVLFARKNLEKLCKYVIQCCGTYREETIIYMKLSLLIIL